MIVFIICFKFKNVIFCIFVIFKKNINCENFLNYKFSRHIEHKDIKRENLCSVQIGIMVAIPSNARFRLILQSYGPQ